MILNGTINYLQLREHKKIEKLVSVPPSPPPQQEQQQSSEQQQESHVAAATVAATTSLPKTTLQHFLSRAD
jgi:hypothetical protein